MTIPIELATFLGLLVLVFTIGLALGGWLMEKKWVANARAIYRIESSGRLYKVLHAPDREARSLDEISDKLSDLDNATQYWADQLTRNAKEPAED